MPHARALSLLAVCIALLAACATPPPVDGVPWISGRMSLRVDASPERTAQNFSAAFDLRGSGEIGELRLVSPLGTQLAQARWSPGLARLTTSDGQRDFASLDELSQVALGEALPLAALPDWLAGRPWPGATHTLSAEGFDQLGWQVALTRRADGFVEARRSAAPALQLRVRLDDAAK